MTRNTFLLWAALLALSGCSLDRGGLGCPTGTEYRPGSLCVPTDGGQPSDDAGDAFVPDGDAGPIEADSGNDSGLDSGPDPIDAGMDAGMDSGPDPVDAGMRCEDTTVGVCIRFTNTVGSPAIVGWAANYHWTRVGGGDLEIPWAASCTEGFRTVDDRTTECEFVLPAPGMPTIGGMIIFAYPSYAIGAACTSTGCPEFFAGYELWIDGVSYSTNPGDGIVSLERRPTPAGMIIVLRITH